MDLKFEIINNIIKQKTNFQQSDNITCLFKFITSDWKSLEKYVIFWDEQEKSFIQSIGKKEKSSCKIPKEILNKDYFYIQIYANDNFYTNKIKIDSFIEPEHCPHQIEKKEKQKNKNKCHEGIDTSLIIDDIDYLDNKIIFYSDKKIVRTIDIVDSNLLNKIKKGTSIEYIVDTILSEDSLKPIANKAVYDALLDCLKESDLSTIAFTGNYNDLKNIPKEFKPKEHNHVVVDVVDYEENINIDLNSLLDLLGDEIAKE